MNQLEHKRYLEPDIGNSALITIDTQVDTMDGRPFEIPGTSAILPNMKKILDFYRQKQLLIIHIVRIYKQSGDNVDLCRKAMIENGQGMLIENSEGSQIAPELFSQEVVLDCQQLLQGKIQSVSATEKIIYKPRWGAFYRTPLENYLQKKGITTIVFCGSNFPNCPRTSIYEASERDFKIILISDAISGLYDKGKQELINIGVHLYETDDLIARVVDSRSHKF